MPQSVRSRLYRLLRWSEQYTNLDMLYFMSGNFWQTLGQVGSSLVALGLMLVFANFLPKETYGTYRYLISLAGLLNIFTLTGMSQAVMQAVSTGRDGALRASVRYQLKWNSILMLVSWALAAYYLWHGNFVYGGALLVLSLCVPLTNAFNTYGAYLAGKRQFRLNNIFSVLSTLIYAAGMVAVIFISGQVVWLVAAYALTMFASTVLFYFLTVRRFKPPLGSVAAESETLRYGRRLTFIGLMGPIVAQADSIILNHFWGAAPLAVYSIAMAIPNRAVPFIKDLVDVGFPKIAAKTPEEIDKTFYQRIAQGLLLGTLFAGVYALAAPYLFKYLLPQYLDAVIYTKILALNFIFAMPNRYLSALLTSQKMIRQIFVGGLITNTSTILLYLVLGIWGGILGLVMAQLSYSVLAFVVNMILWKMRRPVPTI
jgi:O-antigen/teichoic acid export membrane protein